MKFKEEMFKTQPVKLGEGLLNPASKELAVPVMDVQYIDMDLIDRNSKNDYSIEGIEQLAQMIKLSGGIEQPLIVYQKENGRYDLTTGERRWLAAKWLRDHGEWKQGNAVPCVVKDPRKIDLPLSDDLKEMFSILVTNQYRDKTDGDKLLEMRKWKSIFDELRKNGVEYATFMSGEGEESRKIKGEKTRILVAEQMNETPAQIGRLEKLDKHGSDELVKAVLDNRLTLSTAETVMEMPPEAQTKFLSETEGEKEVSTKKAKEYKAQVEEKITLDSEDFICDIKEIQEKLSEGKITLTESQHKKYKKCIAQLAKILQV